MLLEAQPLHVALLVSARRTNATYKMLIKGAGMEQQRTGYVLALTAAVIWAFTSPGIKFILETYGTPTLTLAFWRDAFAAATVITILLATRPALLRVGRRDLLGFALVGALSIGFYHAIWVTSIELNGAAVAIVLIYTFPVFVTLGAWLLWGERPSNVALGALAVSLLGCALLVRAYDPQVLRLSWLGGAIGILSALVHAVYVLYNQRAMAHHSPWTALAYTMLFGALALGLTRTPATALAVGQGWQPWVALALLGAGPTLLGYGLFTASLRYLPGRVASLVATSEVPISVLLAVTLLGERIEWPQLVGMGCILLAVVLPPLIESRQRKLGETQPQAA